MFKSILDEIFKFLFGSKVKVYGVIFFTCLALLSTWGTVRIWKGCIFDNNFTYHLEKSSEADYPIDKRINQVNIAISFLESKKIVEGFTSITNNTESENLETYYNNIVLYKKSLESIHANKEMESLYENNEKNIRKIYRLQLIVPEGISIYPYNKFYFVSFFVSLLLTCVSFINLMNELP